MFSTCDILLSAFILVSSAAAQQLSFLQPCSRSLPEKQLTQCVTEQAKVFQPYLVRGIPELNLEPMDPLALHDVSAKAGTFSINSKNVILKGLRKMHIRDMAWGLNKPGYLKLFGNLTFLSDYETVGRILIFPITGNGKLSVRIYNSEIYIQYKVRVVKGKDGKDHLLSYDLKASQTYGNVKLHMTNLLGGAAVGDTINQVLNQNWRELMKEVGPPYLEAAASKVHAIINQLYEQVPMDYLLAP